ncbi:MAG: hypothetical protein JNM66_00990 [Bryobacterales bacterium]|nr:hypothetical protein [Bryobacterales bacterium]
MRHATVFFHAAALCGLLTYGQERFLAPIADSGVSADGDGHTLSLPAPEPDQVSIRERNGEWVLGVRVTSPGAAGLQVFVENLRLPEGAQLAVYELGANGDRGRLAAVYESVGPLYGDPFWTAPVAGAEALLEVTFAGGAAGDLPFQVSSLRHLTADGLEKFRADAAPASARNAELEGTRGYAKFRGVVVPYEVRDGMALFEGDIVLGPAELVQQVSSKERNEQRQSVGLSSTYFRWTAGVVPYEIDPTLPSQSRITDAIAHWNTKLAGTITLRPRNGEAYYVRFVNTTSSGTCSSYIGNNYMAAQAITIGSSCGTGNVIHEIGHAIGLFHEHTREDRNSFVKINFANINTSMTGNFEQQASVSDDLGAYDYGSIMHYPATAFSINGLPTIETIPAGISIGQRSGLSAGDIGGVKAMYPTVNLTAVPVTVGSNPSGLPVIVDGVTVTAPASFQWVAGSAHTVSAGSVTSGSTRTVFKNWSDGGAQTHTITVPTTTWTVTANFQKQYRFTAVSSDASLGTVGNTPLSSDAFYNEGTAVSVTATPQANSCLASWTGIAAPPSAPVTVTVNQPYGITGNFQTGSITAAPAAFTLGAAAGTGTISVSSGGGCPWTAKSNASWITIRSGASGTGSGTVGFSVSKRNGKNVRTGTITVGPATVTVTQ